MTASARPSKGWRSRVIITESGKSRRWVVCRPFFRQHRLGAVAEGGPASYRLSVGAALHRALAKGSGADGGRQRRAADGGNAAGRGYHSLNAKGNFCLRLSWGNRRLVRGRDCPMVQLEGEWSAG